VDGVRPEVDRRTYRRSIGHAPCSDSLDGLVDVSSDGVDASEDGEDDVGASAASDPTVDVSAGASAIGAGSGGGGGLTGRMPGSGVGTGDGVGTPDVAGVTDGCGEEAGIRSVARVGDAAVVVLVEAVDLTGAAAAFGAVDALAGAAGFAAAAGFVAGDAFGGLVVESVSAAGEPSGSMAPGPASSRILPRIEVTSVAAAAASRSRFSSFSLASSTWRSRLSAVARARSSSLVSFWIRFFAFLCAVAVADLAAAATSSAAVGCSPVADARPSCPFERLRSVRLWAITSSWVRGFGRSRRGVNGTTGTPKRRPPIRTPDGVRTRR